MENNYIPIKEILSNPAKFSRKLESDIYFDHLKSVKLGPLMGIKSLEKKTVLGLGNTAAIRSKFESTTDWGFLKPVKNQIELEISNLTSSYEKFMTTPSQLNPREIGIMINYFKLRLRRLNLVCKPDYGTTTGKKKLILKKENREVEYEYDMTKIYWFDDSGKRIRKINKNFGRRDVIEFEKQFGDYLLNNIKGLEILDFYTMKKLINEVKSNYIPDLCVKHDEVIWFVEFKHKKGELIGTSIIFELWNLYKETYQL
jgi:hypothetical protein